MLDLIILIYLLWVMLIHKDGTVEHKIGVFVPVCREKGHDVTRWSSWVFLWLPFFRLLLDSACLPILLDKLMHLVI